MGFYQIRFLSTALFKIGLMAVLMHGAFAIAQEQPPAPLPEPTPTPFIEFILSVNQSERITACLQAGNFARQKLNAYALKERQDPRIYSVATTTKTIPGECRFRTCYEDVCAIGMTVRDPKYSFLYEASEPLSGNQGAQECQSNVKKLNQNPEVIIAAMKLSGNFFSKSCVVSSVRIVKALVF